MPHSMTGFGRGDVTLFDRRFIVEIKSVNHRFNDISIKLPRTMNRFEEDIKKIILEKVSRGKTDVYISMESFSANDISINVNQTLADAYFEGLGILKSRYCLKDDITLSLMSKFSDIITIDKNITNEEAVSEIRQALSQAVQDAASSLIEMRKREGEHLKADILKKLVVIEERVMQVKQHAPIVAQDYRERLKAKINDALSEGDFDEKRFIMEVTLFVDKSCIDEEITRLLSHILQMRKILDEDDAIGRKLDFLTQEMNREVNTIGSKSNDLQITNYSVELKSELEKIREQIQNIE